MTNITDNDPRFSEQRQKMHAQRRIQTIDEPNNENQLQVMKQLKESIEVLAGERGRIRDRGVSVHDLEDLGLLTINDYNNHVQNNNIMGNSQDRIEALETDVTALESYNIPISDETIATSKTNHDIASLDGNTHGGYRLEMYIVNGTASVVTFSLYFNTNYTATNYDSQYVWGNGTSNTAARSNTAAIATVNASTSSWGVFDINLADHGSNTYYIRTAGLETRQASGAIDIVSRGHFFRTSVTNLTDIRINSSVTNGIGAGSVIRLWRKK